jgi:hypothetical protein
MANKNIVGFVSALLLFCSANGQPANRRHRENMLSQLREGVVAIGYVGVDTQIVNNTKIPVEHFISVGTGLVTYVMKDSILLTAIITAGHVVKFFWSQNLPPIIRPAAADTFKTTDYYGIPIPLESPDFSGPSMFLFPDPRIDLGCIVFPKRTIRTDDPNIKTIYSHIKPFPYHNMTTSFLDEDLIICGYPSHIDANMDQNFNYIFCTFKHGFVTWTPNKTMKNPDLNHISLLESNATFGNSGSPVFVETPEKPFLVGILVSVYIEMDSVLEINKPAGLKPNGPALFAKSRAGVSIIENASMIQDFLVYIHQTISKK